MIDFQGGIKFLADGGLNILTVFDNAALPEKAVQIMMDSGVPLAEYRRLVLVGHGGRRMWEALQERGMETADPVDHYSILLTRQFVHNYLDDMPVLWLYPGIEFVIPLQQLGETAGWSYPSPLGSGISPVYGVWFAYRAAFLIDAELPLATVVGNRISFRSQSSRRSGEGTKKKRKNRSIFSEAAAPSPCDSCLDKPCIQSCPVGAVRQDSFAIEACARHRLRRGSPCADRCLARIACPYFPEHRYTLPQIQYHYGRSLETLREWYGVNRG